MQNHNIEILTKLEISDKTKELISNCAKSTLDYHDIKYSCGVDITITDNEEIRALNLEYLEKDYATDVLSFPLVDFLNGKLLDNLTYCIDPNSGLVSLGDMVISNDKVLEQSLEYGHSSDREFAFLTVHSILHLIGYDHEESEEDGDLMRFTEKEILTALDILR